MTTTEPLAIYGGYVVLAAEDGYGNFVLSVRQEDGFYELKLRVGEERDEPYVAATVTQTHRIERPDGDDTHTVGHAGMMTP